MTALSEPTISFTASPALRLAQHEVRTAPQKTASNWPVLDLFVFTRNRVTSVAVRTLLSGTKSAVADPNVEILHCLTAPQVSLAKTTRDLVTKLREMGMPISGIAELVGVQRKTVYSWVNENVIADSRNHDRLQAISDLLCEEPAHSLQFLTRHWDRQLPEGGTLKTILAADSLDLGSARKALTWLRPAVLRSAKQSRHHSGSQDVTSPASSLTEYLEAVTQ